MAVGAFSAALGESRGRQSKGEKTCEPGYSKDWDSATVRAHANAKQQLRDEQLFPMARGHPTNRGDDTEKKIAPDPRIIKPICEIT